MLYASRCSRQQSSGFKSPEVCFTLNQSFSFPSRRGQVRPLKHTYSTNCWIWHSWTAHPDLCVSCNWAGHTVRGAEVSARWTLQYRIFDKFWHVTPSKPHFGVVLVWSNQTPRELHALHPPEGHNMSQLWNRMKVFLPSTQHQHAPGCQQLDCRVVWKCSGWPISIAYPHSLNSLKRHCCWPHFPLCLPLHDEKWNWTQSCSISAKVHPHLAWLLCSSLLFFVSRNPFSQSYCKFLCYRVLQKKQPSTGNTIDADITPVAPNFNVVLGSAEHYEQKWLFYLKAAIHIIQSTTLNFIGWLFFLKNPVLQLCTQPRATNHEGIQDSIGATQKGSAIISLQNKKTYLYLYIYVYLCFYIHKARSKQNSRGSPDTTSKGRRPQIDKDTANFVRNHKAQCVFSSVAIREMFKLVVLRCFEYSLSNRKQWRVMGHYRAHKRNLNHQRTIRWISGLRHCHTTLSIPGWTKELLRWPIAARQTLVW